jgi:ATP-binding protein involved in chromosome partitioning
MISMAESVTEQDILRALTTVQDPELHRDVVSAGMIKDLKVNGSQVSFTLELTSPACPMREEMERTTREAVIKVPGVTKLDLNLTARVPEGRSNGDKQGIPGVKHAVVISSGKGGVGKTTVSVNLAVALAQTGAKVGLLDCDIYGPNVPIMVGMGKGPAAPMQKLETIERYGVKVMSIGFLTDPDQPIIWRGPMLHGVIQQFLKDVDWGELDYLVIDMPPGTGDAQLTITQLLALSGGIIVITPQPVALGDAVKGANMFVKMDVPLLGIIENMSYFLCPHCDGRTEVFGHGGAREMCEKRGWNFLGEVPLVPEVRVGGDEGVPVVVSDAESAIAEVFRDLAKRIAGRISVEALTGAAAEPLIEIR